MIKRFRLDDVEWVKDPRAEAGLLVSDLAKAEELYAEAMEELTQSKVMANVWEATLVSTLLVGKRSKWPEWRVQVEVRSDPKYKAHQLAVAAAQVEVTRLNGIRIALGRKAWFIAVLYNIDLAH